MIKKNTKNVGSQPTDVQTDHRRLLDALAENLLVKRDEAVQFRASSGVERRWREDEKMFDGFGEDGGHKMIDYATGEAYLRNDHGPKRSRVVVNIIRGKCETAEGRFADIQLPTDDRNWGLKVTPVPKIVEALKDNRPAAMMDTGQPLTQPDGQPMQISDVAKSDVEKSKDCMREMESVIDDQLTECGFNGECRKVIRDAVRLGTGVLKGPNVVKRLNRSWAKQQISEDDISYAMEMVEDFQPASKRVDCWNVFPDPDCEENIQKAAFVWEREEILPRDVRNLYGVDGYFDDQIRNVLLEDPKRTLVVAAKSGINKVERTAIEKGHAYEKWEYYGDLNREDMLSLGCDCEDTWQDSVSACVVFINDRPVKVQLNTLDSGELPYDFFQWTTSSESPWGIGIPRMMQWQQRIVTAAWRAMMDNAGDSSGANIIVGPGVEPADGKWELTGKKIWRGTGEVDDVRAAMTQFQVTNNQVELQNIIDLALRFIDVETSLPMLFQGEKGDIPETLGATNIMVDANNVALRTRVKIWDDQITRPHVGRYYDWNMQYSAETKIKGDYGVDARGTSVLLEKDQQAQSLLEVLAIKQDPDMAQMIDWEKAVRQLMAARRLDILKSEEEINSHKEQSAQQQPPQDPRVEGSIQVATIRTEGEMQKEELRQQSDMAEIQFKDEEAERQRQHEREIKNMEFQIKQMEFAAKSNLSLEQVKAKLAMEAQKLNTQVALAQSNAEGPQITTPIVEPAGRARDGRAFPE